MDERYGSVYGLREDLLECQQRLANPDSEEVSITANEKLSYSLLTLMIGFWLFSTRSSRYQPTF